MRFLAIAIFCEDIREEKSGQETIVGIFPDNLNVSSVPGMLPKLGIYVRFHLNAAYEFRAIRTKLRVPGADDIPLGTWEEGLVAEVRENALSNGMPFAGLISKTLFAPFPVTAAGRLELVAEIDGADHICGALNVVVQEQSSTTT
jgi:hypothetical protein